MLLTLNGWCGAGAESIPGFFSTIIMSWSSYTIRMNLLLIFPDCLWRLISTVMPGVSGYCVMVFLFTIAPPLASIAFALVWLMPLRAFSMNGNSSSFFFTVKAKYLDCFLLFIF